MNSRMSSIYIFNTSLKNSESNMGKFFFYGKENLIIHFDNFEIINIQATNSICLIYIDYSNVSLTNLNIYQYNKGLLGISNSQVYVVNSSFYQSNETLFVKNKNLDSFSTIMCTDCLYFIIKKCHFSWNNNILKNGGVNFKLISLS